MTSNSGFGGEIKQTMAESTPSWPPVPSAPAGAPNVVVMIVDDLGYADLAGFGSEIPTPHLDAVADEGLRLTNFHATPVCSPTRASLLTGCNPHAVGFGFTSNVDPGFPGYTGELPSNQPTMAEILRDNGYSTLMIGKWHLCKDSDLSPTGNQHSWPLQRGFEQFYGFLEAQTNLHQPHRMYDGNQAVQVDEYPEDYYLTDDLTARATTMLHEVHASDPHKPFFLYYAHGAVHSPLQAKNADIERFRGAYAAGWDRIRDERFARQQQLGVVGQNAPLPVIEDAVSEGTPRWAELSDDEQRLAARYMEVYAAMVVSIDESCGAIRAVLEELGLLDDTIFVVLSDNGAATGGNRYGEFNHLANLDRSDKRSAEEKLSADLARIDEIGGPTSWPAYAAGWATCSNTPFRKHKFTTWRGGHQVPFVLSWRNGPVTDPSGLRGQYLHVSDVLPTLLEMIGLSHPGQRHGIPSRALDGASFAPLLADPTAATRHTEQYYECMGQRAFYRDDWEVVAQRIPMTSFSRDRWTLFDVAVDPAQSRDVAGAHPQVVDQLVAAWEDAATANQVYPLAEGSPVVWFQTPESNERYAREVRLHPRTPSLERFRSSQLIDGRSFRITVDWDYRSGDSGVLFAHGGQEAGYVCYVLDEHLHFFHNAFSRPLRVKPIRLSDSSRQVVVEVTAPGRSRWLVDVTVDGDTAVRGTELPALSWLVPWNGIDIGIDRRSPVCWELHESRGTFPFSGRLHAVTYTPGELAPDAMPLRLAQFKEKALDLQ